MKTIIPLLVAFCLLLPGRAQSTQDPTLNIRTSPDASPASPPPSSPAPAMPRNIMPQSLNHKPNAVNPPPEIAASIDKFFKGLKGGNYADSYETFLAGSRLGVQKEKMSAMISRTEEGFGIYGKMNDYEIFDNYSVGSNVLILTYLTRHDIQPLRWRFIYYRADKTWQLNNMGFDDFLLDMLD
jgi:hypothetical protein